MWIKISQQYNILKKNTLNAPHTQWIKFRNKAKFLKCSMALAGECQNRGYSPFKKNTPLYRQITCQSHRKFHTYNAQAWLHKHTLHQSAFKYTNTKTQNTKTQNAKLQNPKYKFIIQKIKRHKTVKNNKTKQNKEKRNKNTKTQTLHLHGFMACFKLLNFLTPTPRTSVR